MAAQRALRGALIETEADIRRGTAALTRSCPHMRRIHAATGDPPLRRIAPGLDGLARIVVGQQVSAASAEAIWQRVESRFLPLTPRRMLKITDEDLRDAGISRPKARTLRALSESIARGDLDMPSLASAPDDAVREALTRVPGIGPWTADIYLMFSLGRADSWAAGDLALQIATQSVLGLGQRPTANELAEIAERWRPWRGVAARLLWAHYALPRSRAPKEPTAAPRRRLPQNR